MHKILVQLKINLTNIVSFKTKTTSINFDFLKDKQMSPAFQK